MTVTPHDVTPPATAVEARSAPRRVRGIGLALTVALLALAVWWWNGSRHEPAAVPERAAAPADTVTLSAEAVRNGGIALAAVGRLTRGAPLEAPAVIALDEARTARIGSMVEGTVVETHVEVGDRVRAGTVLAELHSHVVHDAWADYRRAIADRRRLTTELAFATSAEERAQRLLASKAISQQELQRAQADKVAATEQLDMAATEVRRAEEALEHYGVTNKEDPTGESGETIPAVAPLTGVVLERDVTQGTAVTPGMLLFVVSDLSEVWVLAEVEETHVASLGVGRPVEVSVAAYPGRVFPGRVTFVGDLINPKTRRLTVRCAVSNPDGRLKPNMYATVALGTGAPREVLVVPAAAIQDLDGRSIVFVGDAAGGFRAQTVSLGPVQDGLVEVRQGLTGAERVVTAGAFLLKSELQKATLAGD